MYEVVGLMYVVGYGAFEGQIVVQFDVGVSRKYGDTHSEQFVGRAVHVAQPKAHGKHYEPNDTA